MDASAPPTKLATAIHITALDGIVNVNSLFTLAVFIGLSWNPGDPTNGLIDPTNNPTCFATPKISEDLVAFHVYSFSSFLFSSLVALGLKQAIRISSGSSRFPRTFHLSSDLTFDLAWVNKNLLRVGYLVSAAGSVSGCVFLMLALINVVQIKLGTLACGSAHTYGAVVPLVILVPSALLIYTDSTYVLWKRCDDMVSSWVMNALSKELASGAIYAESARELWVDLRDRFSQINGPSIFQIQRDISSISQERDSISSYFTRLKTLWDELNLYNPLPTCSCGATRIIDEYQQRARTIQFLMGLDDTYILVRGQILLMDPIPTVSKAFSLVLQEERQRSIVSQPPLSDAAALMARGGANFHRDTQLKKPHNSKRPTCEHCNWVGHVKDKCYKLHGYPPGHRLHKNGPNLPSPAIANQVSSIAQPGSFPFTPAQCQQLLQLLPPSQNTNN
ncbi:hypothetical protein RHSIM_Rhsim03G0137800 [Rhododendron simsii]|uniref:Retrotransposon gag domain-containing protein n=1 Tax=Rhododendron simsii TaxID=118357 RepID=A0A834H9R0_RHOSS|nr:hypothetical protein RHSIM_Rhsim03G0137800 [Rhododendron simsii]